MPREATGRAMLLSFGLLFVSCQRTATEADSREPQDGLARQEIWRPVEGHEALGRAAPAWPADLRWINSTPLSLAELRGRVVLLRFWLIDCPLCTHTAPALLELHGEFEGQGLTVLGFHHPKSPRSRDPKIVASEVNRLGFRFPVAMDDSWDTLNAYWSPEKLGRRYTSVSFLIDRRGIIRWLHDGGEFHDSDEPEHATCASAYRVLRREIQRLLTERD